METGKRRVMLLLALYFGLHLIFRTLLSDSLELDEAEQFLWAQDLLPGYGPELPLYTWLQAGFFALFGHTVFAFALLKNLLLFGAYFFTYLGAREICSDRCGRVAVLLLFCIPQVVWESQRVLTHMILATTLAAMTLYFFLKICRDGRIRYHIAFGLTAGFGMLAKYSFALFLLALLVAAVSIPSLRPRLAGRPILASLAMFLLVTAVPYGWIAAHPSIAFAKKGKLVVTREAGLLPGYLKGLSELAGASLSFLAPPLLILGKSIRNRGKSSRDERVRLVGRTLLAALVACVLLVFCFGATRFRVRWLQPMLFCAPLWLAALAGPGISARLLRRLQVIALGAGCFVLFGLQARTLFAGLWKPNSLNEPYAALADEMKKSGFRNGLVVTESQYLGGNLKLQFPESRVTATDRPTRPEEMVRPSLPILVVWNAERRDAMPAELSEWVTREAGSSRAGRIHYAEAPYHYLASRTMRLGYLLLPPAGPERGAATVPPAAPTHSSEQ